jgi:transcriptional regulator with XRE-family HTH domain
MTTTTTPTVLRRIRQARGLSAVDLSAAVPCSRMTLWRIESGQKRDVRPRIRVGLERALGVPFDVLAAPDTKNAAIPKDDGAGVPSTSTTTNED